MTARTAAEVGIAQVWQDLLGLKQLSVTDNFFDLGGHSLLAMQAVVRIEQATQQRINVRRLIFGSVEFQVGCRA